MCLIRTARFSPVAKRVWLGLLASYLYMDRALLSTVLFGQRDPVPTIPVPLFLP